MNKRGQVTIPKELRDRLNLKPGDLVHFVRFDKEQKTVDLEPVVNPNKFILHLKFVA